MGIFEIPAEVPPAEQLQHSNDCREMSKFSLCEVSGSYLMWQPTLPLPSITAADWNPSVGHLLFLNSLLTRTQLLGLAGSLCEDAYLGKVLIALTAEPYCKSLGYDTNKGSYNWKNWSADFVKHIFTKKTEQKKLFIKKPTKKWRPTNQGQRKE